jgi:hypothetical protein
VDTAETLSNNSHQQAHQQPGSPQAANPEYARNPPVATIKPPQLGTAFAERNSTANPVLGAFGLVFVLVLVLVL